MNPDDPLLEDDELEDVPPLEDDELEDDELEDVPPLEEDDEEDAFPDELDELVVAGSPHVPLLHTRLPLQSVSLRHSVEEDGEEHANASARSPAGNSVCGVVDMEALDKGW
jgi:hypothetical protein